MRRPDMIRLHGRRDEERPDDLRIELAAADHEEPTWEIRAPGGSRPRIDRRTRSILAFAAIAAIVVNVGAAWAYWRITGAETPAAAGTTVEMVLRARSDLNRPLRPGQKGSLTVTVTNDNSFPIRITSIAPGGGHIVAEQERREAGCTVSGVRMTQTRFDVSWDVPRNTIGAFTIPAALVMRPDAAKACSGAWFTIPVEASGVSRPG